MNINPPITLDNKENINSMERENTTVLYSFSIQNPPYVAENFILESVESSARLFLDSVLNESNNRIQGLEGKEGSIEMKEIEATTVRRITEDREEKCKFL